MLYTIYKVTHRESSKIYIGKHQTKNLDDGYMGSGRLIRLAVKKHGREAFDKEILYVCETEAEMNTKEAELVTEEFCLREDTYNLCPGGIGSWSYVNASGKAVNISQNIELAGGRAKVAKMATAARTEKMKADPDFKQKFMAAVSKSAKDRMKDGTHNFQRPGFSPNLGKMWINDGNVNKKIHKDSPLPDGWNRGRTK